MAGTRFEQLQWSALLQLLFATALPGPHAQPTAADAGPQALGSPSANGSYLGSRLMAPKSERSCPPDIDPMYRADAIVTGTDMCQRPIAMRVARGNYLVLKLSLSRRRDIA